MSNGVVITQTGIDIDRAQDFQKSLDSRWKSLDIAYEADIDFTSPAFGSKTGVIPLELFRHNLNKLAPFEIHLSTKSGGNPDMFSGVDLQQLLYGDENSIYISTTWFSGQSTNALHVIGKLRVYNIDISEEFSAPAPTQAVPGGATINEVGALFIDQQRGGRNINSNDLQDFTLNTTAKAINIHKHGLQRANSTLKITHDIGYPPTYMLCVVNELSDDSKTLGALTYAQGYLITANTRTLTIRGVQVGLGTKLYGYIILKDPADIAS